MTTTTLSGSLRLACHVRLIRDAADLVEQAGVTGLALCPEEYQIVIQVPQELGDLAARVAVVARLAALTGGRAALDQRPGGIQGRVRAAGIFAGHPVRICTPVAQEQAP